MPIFRRDAPAVPPPAAAGIGAGHGGARRATVTTIAPGTKIRGEVTGSTEIQVEGEIEGNVRVDGLVVVGTGGSVLGPVHGRVVRVAGQVVGNVAGTERVEVSAAGTVEGDIAAPRVVIAEGAFFKGKIDMKSDDNREARRPPAPDARDAPEDRDAPEARDGAAAGRAGGETSKTAAAPAAQSAGSSEARSR